MSRKPAIVWFRADLRLADNKALQAAIKREGPVLPVFILDDETPGAWRRGGASRWWLHHSLSALSDDIETRGNHLILRRGKFEDVLLDLAAETGADEICFSRGYEPWMIACEERLKTACDKAAVHLRRFAGSLLKEPDAIATKAGDPYRVYTPFWRALSEAVATGDRLAAPKAIAAVAKSARPASDKLADWGLLPRKPNWADGFDEIWQPGEAGAKAQLKTFLKSALSDYADDRNRPDIAGTSRLSPHLHFGEIAPAEVWRQVKDYAASHSGNDKGLEVFLKELVWREFSYHLLFHFPTLPEKAFRENFEAFPWRRDKAQLTAWQQGQTGYPIVDAGMRELWQTGYMHNRVRMVVASFLIKHLLLPWQDGEAWFWDTLVDADLANNAASWQWVAGSGADAAPYFRIFNPVTQGEKFDPEGVYVRRYVPEIAKLPDKYIHSPWTAPKDVCAKANVVLGETYPEPIVDHGKARARALAAYDDVKVGN